MDVVSLASPANFFSDRSLRLHIPQNIDIVFLSKKGLVN